MDSLFEKNIYKKLMDDRILFINEVIDDNSSSDLVAKLLYLDTINNDDITIFVNSPGGSVSCGLMIYDTINYIKSDVSIVCIGSACSMAAILLLSGTKGKRKILKHGTVMLHDISTTTEGKYNDLMIAMNEAKKKHDIIFDIIEKNTKLNRKQIEDGLKQDCWLSSEQALQYNIVDEIIE